MKDSREFDSTVKAFIDEIEWVRERKDLELLESLGDDLENYLHFNAYLYKGTSEYCEYLPAGSLSKNGGQVRGRSEGRCELCGKEGTQIHHLAKRGSLVVYHLPELLINLCCRCHRKFHGEG